MSRHCGGEHPQGQAQSPEARQDALGSGLTATLPPAEGRAGLLRCPGQCPVLGTHSVSSQALGKGHLPQEASETASWAPGLASLSPVPASSGAHWHTAGARHGQGWACGPGRKPRPAHHCGPAPGPSARGQQRECSSPRHLGGQVVCPPCRANNPWALSSGQMTPSAQGHNRWGSRLGFGEQHPFPCPGQELPTTVGSVKPSGLAGHICAPQWHSGLSPPRVCTDFLLEWLGTPRDLWQGGPEEGVQTTA